jgi:putative transposase
MKHSKFTEEQIVNILRQADKGEQSVAAIGRAQAISENTFYTWRRKFGSLAVSELRRLRDLEKENARLKRLLAERDLEVDALRGVLGKR